MNETTTLIAGEATEITCETLDTAAGLAGKWSRGELAKIPVQELLAWVRLRMRAYDEGAELMREGYDGELWDRECMVDWLAVDLEIDESKVEQLCELAGWIEPTVPKAADT